MVANNIIFLWLRRIKMHVRARMLYPLDALYDLVRYLCYSNSLLSRAGDRHRLEALLIFYYHKIEKALALPEVRPVFGLGYMGKFIDLLQQWVNEVGDWDAIAFQGSCSTLRAYQQYVGNGLKEVDPTLWVRVNKFLEDYSGRIEEGVPAGVISITADNLNPENAWEHYSALVFSRSSVRNFTQQPVPDAEIDAAVRLAQRTPSVCNRQCWRIHVFSSSEDKALVLKYQNGNAGFGHLADRILLVTADLRAFVSSGERNQAFIDGGLFAMTLMLALQARGIASCPLNLGLSFPMDRALRKAAKIPVWESVIMMVAIGYPPEKLAVAASARLSIDSMLRFRNLKDE